MAAAAVNSALDSRLNRTRDDDAGGGGAAGSVADIAAGAPSAQRALLSVEEARGRGRFLRLSEPGDLDVRIFDDVFLG